MADKYDAALKKYLAGGDLNSTEQDLIRTLQNEHSERGEKARKGPQAGNSWGILGN